MGAIADFFGDLNAIKAALTTKPQASDTRASMSSLLQANAKQYPNDISLLCEDETITWSELNTRANRIAHQLKAQGIGKGDRVSLFMQNRIEFVVCLFGICKLGAIAALVNTNLTRTPLVHCINLIESRKCIFGEELIEPLNEIRDEVELDDGTDFLYVVDQDRSPPPNWAVRIDSTDAATESTDLAETDAITLGQTALYLFTSGTTGLPKAAIVSHKRILYGARMSSELILRMKKSDRMYNCLPLYHGTSFIIGFAAVLHKGASMVIRRRLSVSAFWDDIRKYHCTSFVYIGEFIRYLLSKPVSPEDANNPVERIIGNGLRPDIWMEFKDRFKIPRIGEFYTASEGNGGFANIFNKNCTVGLGIAPIALAAYDVANDEIIRSEDGFCVEVNPGEPGLLLIRVTEASQFEGYTSAEATEKKLLRNVLEEGDIYFNSGDLMKEVKVGFSYGKKHYQFVDRVGDTFRWKSENVSTSEVGEIINSFSQVQLASVYGVQIPATDGRAGMASIVFNEDVTDVDWAGLSNHVINSLPSYARPIFIRVIKELPTTTTHKLQKNDLREQAYHLDKVTDEILVMKPGESVYAVLDDDYYHQIVAREVSF